MEEEYIKQEEDKFWQIFNNEISLSSEYLSDAKELKDGLPNGILYKTYTGLGATYCELKAKRNSIIVFPYIKLAWEKYLNYGAYFVGTRPDGQKVTEDGIAEHIKSHSESEPIKFCVVAESIEKVINGIKKAGKDPFNDYFLVLDEVEILQIQSGLRNSLPICFEYFLQFTEKCMVSATMIKFSYPEISELESYGVSLTYEKGIHLNILRYEDDPHVSLANEIIVQINAEEGLKTNPIKILIGLNTTKGINQMISILENAGIDDLAVLCGDESKISFKSKYTKKEILKKKLPSRINFATSAYWSGMDIEERYIPYAISLNTRLHHLFTYENLIQFIGRCRLKNNYPPTLILPKEIRSNFRVDPISASERTKDLNVLLENIQKNIRSNGDRKTINEALTNSKSGLIFKSIIDGKPKVNFLMADFELYKEETISRLEENGESFIHHLRGYFEVNDLGLKKVEITVNPDSDEILLEKSLENFLSHLDENYSDFRLLNQIENHWLKAIKVAAFWYLFGRKVLKDEVTGKSLAKQMSENDKDCISKSNSLLEGIRFYTYHQTDFNQFLVSLKGNREGNYTGEKFIEATEPWKHHFPKMSGTNSSTNGSNFLRHFFELEPKHSGGVDRFKVNIKGGLKPFFFKSPYCLKVLENLNQSEKPRTTLSKMNLDARHIINFNL